MNSKKLYAGIVTLVLMLLLSACGSSNNQSGNSKPLNSGSKSMGAGNMNGGQAMVPKGLKEAKNPTYKVGSQVIVHADHMEGMQGAKATVDGAYDTTAYVVTYTPTTGGPIVKNHKWVIQEEIKGAGSSTLKPGAKVTLEADHMKGMMGAKAIIDSAEHTTVYMIDYIPTNGGPIVKNHKWVTESELSTK